MKITAIEKKPDAPAMMHPVNNHPPTVYYSTTQRILNPTAQLPEFVDAIYYRSGKISLHLHPVKR
jgi:hypothetical protein